MDFDIFNQFTIILILLNNSSIIKSRSINWKAIWSIIAITHLTKYLILSETPLKKEDEKNIKEPSSVLTKMFI